MKLALDEAGIGRGMEAFIFFPVGEACWKGGRTIMSAG